MSIKMEVAELMNESGKVYEVAEKVYGKCNLTAEDREIAEVVDAWAKEIGRTGCDRDQEVAQLINKTITEANENRPDELLDLMFDRDGIGEFDDVKITKTPKNTLKAYSAAKGGNVNKSYIDGTIYTPVWDHAQVETAITYAQLRKNGFKSIANLAVFAKEALENHKIATIFNALDAAITAGDGVIAATGGTNGSAIALVDAEALALYVNDMVEAGDQGFMFGLNKYAQAIGKLQGAASLMSDAMKNEYNKYGIVKEFDGLLVKGYSGQKKDSSGSLLVPDKRIFGVAGKVGSLIDRGEIRILETLNNNSERVDLKITGCEYGYKDRKSVV